MCGVLTSFCPTEVKSEVIRRFKVNLEEWNTQLMAIATKKRRNGKFSCQYCDIGSYASAYKQLEAWKAKWWGDKGQDDVSLSDNNLY